MAALGLALWAGGDATNDARADELKSRLQAVEDDLSKNREKRDQLNRAAAQAAKELKDVQQRGISLARSLFRYSARADNLEARLEQLQDEERKKSDAMARRQTQLAATLGALQRMARMPAATLVAIPQSPDNTIRSAILLRAAVPKLQNEAAGLAKELRKLTALRAEIANDRKSLSETLAGLEKERLSLAALTAKKMRLLEQTRTAEQRAARRTARLSARAGTMRELLRELSKQAETPALRGEDFEPPPDSGKPEAVTPAAPRPQKQTAALTPFKLPRGPIPAPGRVVTGFGAKMPNGTLSKGIYIETRPSAPVVAPTKGRVVFAGEFRGYGNLVILELPNRGHALISGMARISANIGDDVLAGEPLGEMAPFSGSLPKLYFEVRRQGRPINPLPPKAARRNKVRG
ncbi:MAG: murein hydrolase activator EnvC family protein [Alphaproteobacteria bacterium]